MPKIFQGLPDEFEQFNPEVLPVEWASLPNTYDENGLFHSYNRLPAEIFAREIGINDFKWYNHGVLERANGEAPWITTTVDPARVIFRTNDENNEPHSYKNNPAIIAFNPESGVTFLEWKENGKTSRQNGLPALISCKEKEIIREAYYLDGDPSRANNLPAYITKTGKKWIVCNVPHNTEGIAGLEYNKDGLLKNSFYALYGIIITENVFEKICEYRLTANVPAWIAFLHVLGFIEEENILALVAADEKWVNVFPTKWIARYFGLNNENIYLKLKKLEESGLVERITIPYSGQTILDIMIRVIDFEKQPLSLKSKN